MRTLVMLSLFLLLHSAALSPLYAQTRPVDDSRIERWISELERGKVAERWNAAYRLGQIGERAAPATDALVKALGDQDIRVVWYSIHALGNIGAKAAAAVPALHEAISDKKETPQPVFVLAEALGDKYTRRFAAESLGQIGPAAKTAAPALRRAMESDDASLSVAAALALWRITEDASAVDVLGKLLATDDVNAAHEAAIAFTHLGSAGRPVIPALVSAVNSGTEDLRRSAARALGQMGPVAIPALTEALAAQDVSVRRTAAQGFDWLGKAVGDKVLDNTETSFDTFTMIYSQLDSSAVAALRVALEDNDADVRRLAGEAIGSLGPVAIPTLVAAIQDSNETLRRSAAYALERIEARTSLADLQPEFADSFRKASVASLSEAIRSEDPFVRMYAVRIFAFMDIARILPTARPQLIRLLKDDNVQVRRYASAALRQMQASSSIPPTTTLENNP